MRLRKNTRERTLRRIEKRKWLKENCHLVLFIKHLKDRDSEGRLLSQADAVFPAKTEEEAHGWIERRWDSAMKRHGYHRWTIRPAKIEDWFETVDGKTVGKSVLTTR